MKILDLKQEPEHLAVLADWHHQQWSYLNPDCSLKQRIIRMQHYFGNHFVPSTFIAKRQSILLGSAAVVEADMDSRANLSPWLASVYVAPQCRQQGIGTKLVSHVVSAARQAGFKNLYLFTPDQVGFYQKLGWSTLEETIYHGCKVTIMEIALKV